MRDKSQARSKFNSSQNEKKINIKLYLFPSKIIVFDFDKKIDNFRTEKSYKDSFG
jgi:hypothetical protein